MVKVKKLLAVTLADILAASTAACNRESALTRYDAQFLQLFDTITSMVGYAKDKETFTAYVQELHDKLEMYHQLYDIYREYRDVNNLKTVNDNTEIESVVVDGKIIDMLKFTKELNVRTSDCFNVATENVPSIWHERRTAGTNNPTTAELLPMEAPEEAGEHMDINDVIIDKEVSTVYLIDADMSFDVGATAKGYATETVYRKLEKDDLTKALVSVGGNVRAVSTKDNGSKWKLGVQSPDLVSGTKFLHMIAVADMSLVASGDYQRYYTVDSVQCHHIVNPDTLIPRFKYNSISILCKDFGVTDVLSTAVLNMKQEDGQILIESLDRVEAIWLYPDGDEKYSSGFQAYTEDE